MAIAPMDIERRDDAVGGGDDSDLGSALARRSRWWFEVLVIAWLVWVYDLTTNLAPIRQALAVHHGQAILRLEGHLHLDPERTLDQWLSGHHTLGLWVATYYDNAHFVVTLAVIGWLWWRHPRRYRPLRSALVVTNVIGFFVFWLYPTAPPRMLPHAGIADVVASTGAFGSWHSGNLAHEANELAAMPSLHLAWAAWCALAVWWVLRKRTRWAWVAWAYPVLTGFAVLATGNHYLADTLAGVATLAVSVALVLLAGRIHRRLRPAAIRR